jgi:Ala-tRNA(Pro) deacylase
MKQQGHDYMNIDKTLYTGRPADKRIDKEERCYALLDGLGVEYWRVDHDYADHIEDCHEVEKVLGCEICKNLLLTNRQQTEIYLLLLPGDKPFKTKILSKQIGTARLSFGTPEQMLETLDITPGSVSVLGLMNDKDKRVHLLIDRDLLKEEYFGCHPCINSSSLKFRTSDLIERIIPAMQHTPEYVELPWETE